MSHSVPLDQLQGPVEGAPADEERVMRILAEMNASDAVQAPPAPPHQQRAVITEPPVAISTGQLRMDAGTARAHVIGHSQPSMADFQAMLQAAPPGMAPFHGPAVIPGPVIPPPTKAVSWKTAFMAQLRIPVVVAILTFVLNLPVVTGTLSRYASWMYLSSGEISVGGLLVKSLLAGFLFAIYQGISSVF